MFWSEIGSGFGEPGGTPSPRIARNTPLPPAREIDLLIYPGLIHFSICVYCNWPDAVTDPDSFVRERGVE